MTLYLFLALVEPDLALLLAAPGHDEALMGYIYTENLRENSAEILKVAPSWVLLQRHEEIMRQLLWWSACWTFRYTERHHPSVHQKAMHFRRLTEGAQWQQK